MEYDMYRRGPTWSPVRELGALTKQAANRVWAVALTGDGVEARMAIAWRQLNGDWTHDREGTQPLGFIPDWFGEPPNDPPDLQCIDTARANHKSGME